MSSEGSVSRWLVGLKVGDPHAAQQLWERYFGRLVSLARIKLQGAPRRAANEEDVALSAFASFCQGVEQGRFPQLDDRDNLWRLLVVLTARKAWRLRRSEGQQKRGGGLAAEGPGETGLDAFIGPEPTPEFAAQVAEASRLLLGRLGDAELEAVALWKMEGYSNAEIAGRLGCAPRSVERKLQLIRSIWEEENTS